jgi:hypothetical protein
LLLLLLLLLYLGPSLQWSESYLLR